MENNIYICNMENLENILSTIESQDTNWRHVVDLACVHTFTGDFYINLCSYKENNKPVISINIDNVKDNINDILDITFIEGSNEYKRIYPIYKKAKESGIQIASESLVLA